MTVPLQQPKITPQLRNAIYRSNFLSFFLRSFAYLNSDVAAENNWHLSAIANRLERVFRGKTTRLIINAPPRSLKSLISSVAFPAYVLGRDPAQKIITASYSQDLSSKHSSDFRKVVESDWYVRLFGTKPPLKNAENEFETASGGSRYATSVGGTLTGRGADIIIIDDPLNAADAHSKPARDRVIEWFTGSLVSRLNSKQTGAIICVMQRLHPDDLTGYLIDQGGWDVLSLPAIAPEDREIVLSDQYDYTPRKTYKWCAGEPLHANREPIATLDGLKKQLGSDKFSAQYLQQPIPPTGNMLKREWLGTYDAKPVKQAGDQIVQSWDTAMKAGSSSDYSVCLTFLVRNKNEYYLMDVLRERLEFPDLEQLVDPHAKKFHADAILIEDKVSGTSLSQYAKRKGLQGVQPISPSKEKLSRMQEQTVKLAARSLLIPSSAAWLSDFLAEYLAFPRGKYDDQMDALSQFLEWRVNREDSRFECDWGHDDDKTPSADEILYLLNR